MIIMCLKTLIVLMPSISVAEDSSTTKYVDTDSSAATSLSEMSNKLSESGNEGKIIIYIHCHSLLASRSSFRNSLLIGHRN